jgi:hypothetical protein
LPPDVILTQIRNSTKKRLWIYNLPPNSFYSGPTLSLDSVALASVALVALPILSIRDMMDHLAVAFLLPFSVSLTLSISFERI